MHTGRTTISSDTKLAVLDAITQGALSRKEIVKKFGLNSYSNIRRILEQQSILEIGRKAAAMMPTGGRRNTRSMTVEEAIINGDDDMITTTTTTTSGMESIEKLKLHFVLLNDIITSVRQRVTSLSQVLKDFAGQVEDASAAAQEGDGEDSGEEEEEEEEDSGDEASQSSGESNDDDVAMSSDQAEESSAADVDPEMRASLDEFLLGLKILNNTITILDDNLLKINTESSQLNRLILAED
jgi:hypothetical protein